MTSRERATVRDAEQLLQAAPPKSCWVSFCTRCGNPIVASLEPHSTSCPDCPIEPNLGPPIRLARYVLNPLIATRPDPHPYPEPRRKTR